METVASWGRLWAGSAFWPPPGTCAVPRKPNTRKQKNGFPPNFIHSLDSSHMMLTALHCYRWHLRVARVLLASQGPLFWLLGHRWQGRVQQGTVLGAGSGQSGAADLLCLWGLCSPNVKVVLSAPATPVAWRGEPSMGSAPLWWAFLGEHRSVWLDLGHVEVVPAASTGHGSWEHPGRGVVALAGGDNAAALEAEAPTAAWGAAGVGQGGFRERFLGLC